MLRITSDLDSRSRLKLFFFIYRGLKNIEKIKKIEIYKSNSKGYHLIFWTTKRYNLKQIFRLRYLIGDDKNRIRLDRYRKIGRNTLFTEKYSKDYKPKISKEDYKKFEKIINSKKKMINSK